MAHLATEALRCVFRVLRTALPLGWAESTLPRPIITAHPQLHLLTRLVHELEWNLDWFQVAKVFVDVDERVA